jgi:hypothetical protein
MKADGSESLYQEHETMRKQQLHHPWRRWALPLIVATSCVAGILATEQPPTVIPQSHLNEMKIMNYYPAAQPGPNMWLNWDEKAIRADVDKMASLHVNVIRLCLPPKAFGYPEPSPKILSELSAVVEMAAQKGMRVHLTLFFMWHDYLDVAGSKTWAKAMLSPFARDSRIAFVELHNEIPERDAAAMSWSRTMLPYLRSVVEGSIPVTISVTGELSKSFPALIAALGSSQPDFYDVHLYNNAPIEAYSVLKAAKGVAAAHGRAILVGETGTSTLATQFGGFPSFARADASYEAYQDYYYRQAFLATAALNLPPVAPWIYSDYKPGSLVTAGKKEVPYHFGLYRADGSAKAAVATVSAFFGSGELDTSFNNGFERYHLSEGRNQPELWAGDTPAEASYEVDTTVAHSGRCSAKISNSGSSKRNPGFYVTPVAKITPGTSYTASVWVKGQQATGTTQICLNWLPHGSAVQRPVIVGESACGGSLAGTTEWKQISVTSVAPAWAASVRIYLQSGHNTGTAWFDDVVFQ